MSDEMTKIYTLDEAFSRLDPKVQAHCKRVSRYAEIVYIYADSHYVYLDSQRAENELRPEFAPLMAAAGLYHEISKAFAEGEGSYHEYGSGAVFEELCETDKRYKVAERRFIQAAIADQNEWMNGEGYPNKKSGDDIPYTSRLLALVSDLDEISINMVSEHPIEDALMEMKELVSKKYDPEFYKALKRCKGKLEKVFKTFKGDSKAVEVSDPIIKRRVTRPMELVYRPVCYAGGEHFAKEATMRFRGTKENTLTYEEVKHIIAERKIAEDLTGYFALECCDMIRRLDACKIVNDWIALETLPAAYNKRKFADTILQYVNASEIDPGKLRLMVSANELKKPTKSFSENMKKCKANGVLFILTDVTKEFLEQTEMTWEEYPFAAFRFKSESMLDQTMQTNEAFLAWEKNGMDILVDDIESNGILETILENGSITGYTGILAGIYEREDDLIKRDLRMRTT